VLAPERGAAYLGSMPKRSSKDVNETAFSVVAKATGQVQDEDPGGTQDEVSRVMAAMALTSAAKAMSSAGAKKGGEARAKKMSPEQRSAMARKAVTARWAKAKPALETAPLPVASYRGFLTVMDMEIPCYVLSDGTRVIGRTSATEMLTGIKGGGALEKYLDVEGFKLFVNSALVLERMKAASVPVLKCHCLRCSYDWTVFGGKLSARCPRCKSPYWKTRRRTLKRV